MCWSGHRERQEEQVRAIVCALEVLGPAGRQALASCLGPVMVEMRLISTALAEKTAGTLHVEGHVEYLVS